MTIYVTRQGTKFNADSATELVEQLQHQESISSNSLQDFMNQMAKRCQTEDGVAIRTLDPEIFIADLIQNDYLSVIDVIDG
ncbi:hypothetical protein NIES593_20190 [Hydrococcus rivularis NIES-593]|uniref:Uncharacterized protein n=1 Tax=Hydrococcus rivularis NIES-593 TaxID=1921803 RepID=A0A1U7H948_9CYAN|nr:hypothetical protein [Hydrococcus rivularis]OKH20103.1 hypothetical protein NIES593_20190 [Hydrococcus rivularis NIES-593]